MFPQLVGLTLRKDNCDIAGVVKIVKKFALTTGYNTNYEQINTETGLISIFDDYETFVIDIEIVKDSASSVTLSVKCFSCSFLLVEKIKMFLKKHLECSRQDLKIS